MASIERNEEYWPVVIATFTGIPDMTDVAHYLTRAEMMLNRRKPYVVLMDLEKLTQVGTKQRQLLASWMKENEELFKAHCLGYGYITYSILNRMILRSVMLLRKMPVPCTVVNSKAEGFAWALSLLEKAGVDFPESYYDLEFEERKL